MKMSALSITLPNGVTTSYVYDKASQLLTLAHKLGTTTLSQFGYTYDKVGNRVSLSTTRTGVTVNNNLSYTYDNLYRLIQATRSLPTQPNETFEYDSLGNRLKRDGQTTNSLFDNANRLLDDVNFTYTYDDNGNLIQKKEKATNQFTTYIYDAENQLTQINLPNNSVAKYRYDGFGRRIEKDVNGVIKRYVYDNEDILFEHNSANLQQARYTHGPGVDEPLIMDRNSQSFFYHADGLGSIIDLTNATGVVIQNYVYDSFGNIVAQNGSLINPYTYTGREFDGESGLYYYRARYYDPAIGRFLQRDPLGIIDNINLYTYVHNNPINFIDPLGLRTFVVVNATGGGNVGFGAGEFGEIIVLDPQTSNVTVLSTKGIGLGLGLGVKTKIGQVSGSVNLEIGLADLNSPSDLTGFGGSVNFLAAAGKGIGGSIFGDFKGNVGSTAGITGGIGLGVSGLVTFTEFKEEINLGDLSDEILEQISEFLPEQNDCNE